MQGYHPEPLSIDQGLSGYSSHRNGGHWMHGKNPHRNNPEVTDKLPSIKTYQNYERRKQNGKERSA